MTAGVRGTIKSLMSEKILMARTVNELRIRVSCWKQEGLRVGFVPTMGALHDGHLALVARAKAHADKVVASVFVNPAQFGPGEDFEAYPRKTAHDTSLLTQAGCHLLYTPETAEMYPPGFATSIHVAGLTDVLCGASRPGHFDGVATVVTKLFQHCQPDIAVFGEKDYQQLLVIRRLVADLDMPVEILAQPIIREPDQLAMSSRNAYLSDTERATAPKLNETMRGLVAKLLAGANARDTLSEAKSHLESLGFRVDYLDIRNASTLHDAGAGGPLDDPSAYRLFAAAWLGKTRLIDNIPIG